MPPPPPPPPPGRPAWSITVRLRHRGWLDLRAAAENVVLPGWGRGGERLSLLVRLRRGLRLAVTSRCGRAPPEKNPRACRIFRFLRSKLARFPSIWRRKKPPPPARATAASQNGYGRGYYEPVGHSKSWRFLVAKKIARLLELEPRLYAWLMKISLNRLLNW
ncbi:hypothetical protein OsI_00551 [Oryza sativa Indica Group]|uniref:Uncharacterized protein n=1 Tax=Oryza sativa subsp. indica TaxID=39946 RepID=B8ADG0_ORYSI|nr:hypothetical protein OsI_00551 [Oryza sativa Indica Group]